jgi:hypothetical protein
MKQLRERKGGADGRREARLRERSGPVLEADKMESCGSCAKKVIS